MKTNTQGRGNVISFEEHKEKKKAHVRLQKMTWLVRNWRSAAEEAQPKRRIMSRVEAINEELEWREEQKKNPQPIVDHEVEAPKRRPGMLYRLDGLFD